MIPLLFERILLLPRRHPFKIRFPAVAVDLAVAAGLPSIFRDAPEFVHDRYDCWGCTNAALSMDEEDSMRTGSFLA